LQYYHNESQKEVVMIGRGSALPLRIMSAMIIVVLLVSCAPAVKETPVEALPTSTEALPVSTEALPAPTEALPTPTEALPTPTEAPVSKGELKIANWGDINTLDPAFLTSVEREFTIMNCIFSGLVKYKEGTWDVVPDLATSWEISADNKEITFHLRHGVQFQKQYGEMTAADVKFSFERIIDPAQGSPEASSWGALDHVEIIDDYTVKLILKAPSAKLFTSTLPLNAGFIVSKKAVEALGKDAFGLSPVGTGPYEFDHWTPGQETVLTAFKDYFAIPPKLAKLTFVPIPEIATAEMALKTGEIDVGGISLKSIQAFQANPDLNVVLKPGLKYWWIGFTMNKPPFDNIKVRDAVRYAINVDEILQAAFNGIPQRANTMFPPGMLGRWEDAPAYQPDLEKAKALLVEAGYPGGAGLELTFLAWTAEENTIIGEVVKSQLEKIGITVNVVVEEVGAFNEATNAGKDNNFYIQFYTTTVDPGYTTEWFQCGQTWNPSQWCNPEYDALWKQADAEMDPVKRAALYVEMQKIVDKDVWAIWLTYDVEAVAMQKYVIPGGLFPNGRLAPWQMDVAAH
jgi:peptide/nickel transport system substrate-binding protein